MSRTMIISSWSAPSTTVTSCDASCPIPANTSRYMRATRAGVSRRPPRSGSSPIPSRIMRTPCSIFSSSKRSSSIAVRCYPSPDGTSPSRTSARPSMLVSSPARGRSLTSSWRLIHTHGNPSCGARLDVVEERRRHVHVMRAVGPGLPEERLPVTERRLVRTDVGRHDTEIHRHPDRGERRVEEVGVGVRQDAELPSARPQLGQANRGRRGTAATRASTPRARPHVQPG